MNRNYNLSLEATVTAIISVNDETVTISTTLTFDPYNDCTDEDGLNDLAKDAVLEEYLKEHATPIDADDITPEIEITGFSEIPEPHAKTISDIFEFAAAFAECDQDIEVVEAALYCGIGASDIDEAYSGSYSSDEDFAQETADQLGLLDKSAQWPYNCIDWEYAAKELMYDYSEHNGHYFRNV